MREDISSLRKEYAQKDLNESSIHQDPFHQFETWFQEALSGNLLEPNAMVLSTVDIDNQPYQRTVLLKSYDKNGFIFFTNYESRKARHIKLNSKVSILFPWYGLERQVIVNGEVEKIATKDSLAYFLSRPRGSQLGAWVSNQSEVISSRSILESKLEEIKQKFKEGKVPLPDHWGGYLVIPHSIEFWQGRQNRLHDRILYTWADKRWNTTRLAP